jgi:hypothetical protein
VFLVLLGASFLPDAIDLNAAWSLSHSFAVVLDLLRVFLLSLGIPWMLLGAFLLVTFVSRLIDCCFLSTEEACRFS